MGKRLPRSKKHRKLKFVDPSYSGPAPKSKRRKLLFNEPPINDNHLKVDQNVEEFTELKNKARNSKIKKKRKRKMKDDFIVVKNTIVDDFDYESERQSKKVPNVVKQKKSEDKEQFFNRLQKMADTALAEAQVEDEYNIELVDVDKQGNAKYVAAPEEKESTNKRKKKAKKKQPKEKQKEEKWEQKDHGEFDLKKERIRFGEVASAPPVLTAKLRKAPALNKAGSRQLMLKDMLPATAEKKVAPLSAKWKTLAPAKRKMAEIEQLRAVEMYRMLKKKKTS